MRDFVDGSAFNFEQGQRARKLFAAVVLAALDDAISDDKKYGNGPEQIARWARSRDGREVLSCAGIDPNERVVKGLMEFVSKGVRTSVALVVADELEADCDHYLEQVEPLRIRGGIHFLYLGMVVASVAFLPLSGLAERNARLERVPLDFAEGAAVVWHFVLIVIAGACHSAFELEDPRPEAPISDAAR